MKPKALVFGATGGLGQAFCRELECRGYLVERVTRQDCDFQSRQSVVDLLAKFKDRGEQVELTVFAAGQSELGYVSELELGALDRCMEVNFLSVTRIFSEMTRGRLSRKYIFLHSGVGEFLMPGLAPLSLAHRALRDFLYFWRMENKTADIQVLSAWTGKVNTRFNERTRVHGRFKISIEPSGLSPEIAAQKVLHALDRGQTVVRLSALPGLLGKIQATLPAIFCWLLSRSLTIGNQIETSRR